MKIIELICESYREGDDSKFTHNGKTYQLDPFLKRSEDISPEYVPINKVDWIIKYTSPDPVRVKNANIDVPALAVNDPKWGLVVIDGLHRLVKSKELGKKSFLVKILPNEWFNEEIK